MSSFPDGRSGRLPFNKVVVVVLGMPYDPTESVPRLRAFLRRDPVLSFAEAFLSDHPGAGLYLVGGAVRDVLLGGDAKDADFVARGRARAEIERWFRARGTLDLVGTSFGVYRFLPEGVFAADHPFVDIALPRRERASADSVGGYRDFDLQVDPDLPIEADLRRRDFTVNAMAFDVRAGELVDPHGGMADLQAGVIRAVGGAHERFGDDLSRLLRAIRFACQLGFTIEDATWKALRERMPEINKKRAADGTEHFVVPRETVGSELAKALVRHPGQAAALLLESGALCELLPEIDEAARADLPAGRQGAAYLAPLHRLTGDLTAALALLMRALPASAVVPALRRVGFATLPAESPLRARLDDVAWIVERLRSPEVAVDEMRPSVFERAFMNGHGKSYLAALRALGADQRADEAVERARHLRHRWGLGDDERIPPLISGDDVVAAGLAPGPRVRASLDAVRDAQLDGTVMTRTHALKWLKQHIGTAF